MSEDRVEVTLEQQQGYRFEARFSNGTPPLITDEPAPLGGNQGPSHAQLLA